MPLSKKYIVFVLLLWLGAPAPAVPQNTRTPRPSTFSGNSCEENIANLDSAHSEAGADELIIMIARLGNSERSRRLTQRRLHNARTYLERFAHRAKTTVITAEGERATGLGQIEVYVKGRLFVTLETGRSQDFYAGSCNSTSRLDTLFYDSRTRTGRGEYIPASGY